MENTTKTISPTGTSGSTSLPQMGDNFINFMYTESYGINTGDGNAFVSFERTDIIQNRKLTIYYNKFSILTNDRIRSMGRLRIQIVPPDGHWYTNYLNDKLTIHSATSTDLILLNLDFTESNYGK